MLALLDLDTIKPQRFGWAHQLDLGGLNMASFKRYIKTEQQNLQTQLDVH